MKQNIWELEIDVSFVSIFSFVSAYLGLESTNCINVLLHEPVSISVNSGTTVNVLIDAKMLVSKMRPKTVQNSKRCKDARIQDAKVPASKMQRCPYLFIFPKMVVFPR